MRALILLLIFHSSLAFAGVEQISEAEFRALAAELAPKVNLFQAGWEKDPKAEFYGGTTRDYLYWLKGQFRNAHNPAQGEAMATHLRALPVIDVRDFIIGDSDIDIISDKSTSLDPATFGVRKIDTQSPDILNPVTELGKNEVLQGYIPAEKIRLARDGFHATTLGDGVKEIYDGKLSIHFASAEDFAKSKYAIEGINHPVLLALRYIRVQAINYFRTHGGEFPDQKKLLAGIDEASAQIVKEVIAKAAQGTELKAYLQQPRFRSWLNGAVQKSFRSYTNPTAALELMKYFGVDALNTRYTEEIEPLNQYVFSKFRDPKKISQALTKEKVQVKEFYRDPAKMFPDNFLYHGTKDEPSFRGIVFQGILPSETGSAGPGLYGVAVQNKEFSERWGGDKDRLLRFPVKSDAKIVDITTGEGERVYRASKLSLDQFAEKYGVDIIAYPYNPPAFVVKNSAALERPEGVYRKVMSVGNLIEAAQKTHEPQEIARLLSVNNLSKAEIESIWQASPVKTSDVVSYLNLHAADPEALPLFQSEYWQAKPELLEITKKALLNPQDPLNEAAKELVGTWKHPTNEQVTFADSLFQYKFITDDDALCAALMRGPLRERPEFTPRATAYALPRTHAATANSGVARGFLLQAKLSESEAAELWKIYRTEYTMAETNGWYLAEGLLRNGFYSDEIKKYFLKELKGELEDRSKSEIAKLFARYFPRDVESDLMLTDYIKGILDKHGDLRDPTAYNLVDKLEDPKNLKAYFFAEMKLPYSGKRNHVIQLLKSTQKSDEDWVKMLRLVRSTDRSPDLFLPLGGRPERSAALSKAILATYKKTATSDPQILNTLAAVMAKDTHPKIYEDYVREILSPEKKKVSPEKLSKVLPLVLGLTTPQGIELDRAKVAYLLANGDTDLRIIGPRTVGTFLQTMALENPEISGEIQTLVSLGKLDSLWRSSIDMVSVAERMPGLSPEFSVFLRGSLAASDPVYKARVDALLAQRPAHAILSDCKAGFAELGGKP